MITPISECHSFTIVRREQSARSRQHRGVFTQVIYECDVLEILRTELDTGSVIEGLEFGDVSAVHLVIDGGAVVRTARRSADLMPGDSVVLSEAPPYTILNGAPSRSVILSVLWKTPAMESRA